MRSTDPRIHNAMIDFAEALGAIRRNLAELARDPSAGPAMRMALQVQISEIERAHERLRTQMEKSQVGHE